MSTYMISDADEMSAFVDQSFDFQSFDHENNSLNYNYTNSNTSLPTEPIIFTPSQHIYENSSKEKYETELDEPPLLDELEIYPHRIIERSLVVLNPFHRPTISDTPEILFQENDLAGPIGFCLTIAVCLFLSGSEAHFSYIYGLSLISVIVMYVLISLMCDTIQNYVTVASVASILGYSILPIVWLSILSIFTSLNSTIGILLAIGAICLSTSGSSRIFCLMTGDPKQRLLIAYPCALVYIIFTLLVLF